MTYTMGVSGLVVECRTRNFQVAGSNLTVGHLQATLNKLLTYDVLRSTQPPTFRGTEMSSSLRVTGRRPSVADWGSGMTASCTAGSTVRWRRKWMAA